MVDANCQCNEKMQSKAYLEFPMTCSECYKVYTDTVVVYYRYGCAEPKTKSAGATWIHKTFNLTEELIAAVSIPNTNNIVVITSK